jgi:hypothetical protein
MQNIWFARQKYTLKSIYRSSTKLYMIGENLYVYKQWSGLPGKNASIRTSA